MDHPASGVHGGGLGNLDDLATGAPFDIRIADIGDEPVVGAVANADVVLNIRRRT